jgi:hypothetical protein
LFFKELFQTPHHGSLAASGDLASDTLQLMHPEGEHEDRLLVVAELGELAPEFDAANRGGVRTAAFIALTS